MADANCKALPAPHSRVRLSVSICRTDVICLYLGYRDELVEAGACTRLMVLPGKHGTRRIDEHGYPFMRWVRNYKSGFMSIRRYIPSTATALLDSLPGVREALCQAPGADRCQPMLEVNAADKARFVLEEFSEVYLAALVSLVTIGPNAKVAVLNESIHRADALWSRSAGEDVVDPEAVVAISRRVGEAGYVETWKLLLRAQERLANLYELLALAGESPGMTAHRKAVATIFYARNGADDAVEKRCGKVVRLLTGSKVREASVAEAVNAMTVFHEERLLSALWDRA